MPFYDDDGDGFRGDGYHQPRRQHNPPLHTEKIVTDRKIFFLDLKENDRGRVVKITEDVRGRRDTIMLPVDALREFIDALQRIDEAQNGAPAEAEIED
jgi:PurA ssDNA and RNA-binding protein